MESLTNLQKVDVLFGHKGREALISQFLNDGTMDLHSCSCIEEYRGEFLFLDFAVLDFKTTFQIVVGDIKGFFLVFLKHPVFKWYHSFIISRASGMVHAPFGRSDFRKALKILNSIKKGIK